MTKDQESHPLKTLQEIEAKLDPHPSPGGDVLWLLDHALTNLKEEISRLKAKCGESGTDSQGRKDGK